MPAYSLSTSAGPIDLAPYGWTRSKDERVALLSVPSSRRGAETIENPEGLQADALRAAERVALDLLAATGVAQRVEVVKTLADGTSRRDGEASATLDPRQAGYAIVESHGRGARRVPIASIVERDGERGFSALVLLAQRVARAIVEETGADEEIASIAAERSSTPAAIRALVNHGVAAAGIAADAARSGRSPSVALVLPVSEIL